MIKRIIHSIVAASTALLLLFGTTAKEYIHLFAGHEDTVHCQHESEGLSFEKEHHHCSFLSYTLSPFIEAGAVILNDVIYTAFHAKERFIHERIIVKPVSALSLRGPPAYLS